ncbi:YtxH domain-containing protein [Metabacillus malikii]|uniref:Gas vesicle protein n=1 Tax=Metabacillus malikii TaxID=1504265 RepID=A0ABT9ZIL6_9BACI|nr:YtxH domain-containing protein [Metabacillus malikii]MDQ0231652.1 gas vesicle protein [Metabacillus malikii]
MSNENKLLKGMVIGAIVGAAVSMFDKNTRQAVLQSSKSMCSSLTQYVKQPTKLTTDVKRKVDTVRDTVQEVSDDLAFINEKVNELKESSPHVIHMLQETKDKLIP